MKLIDPNRNVSIGDASTSFDKFPKSLSPQKQSKLSTSSNPLA
jgi:hypothetical protein